VIVSLSAIATNDTGTTLLVSRTQAPASGSGSQLRSKSVSGIVVYEQTESSEWQVGHYLIPAGNHGAASLVQVSTNSDASVVSAALTDPVMALTDITTWIRTDAGYTFRSQLNNPDTEMNGFADNLVLSRNGERLAVGAPLRRDASLACFCWPALIPHRFVLQRRDSNRRLPSHLRPLSNRRLSPNQR